MQTSENQELESYVPVYDVVPEKWEDARMFLVEQLKRITNAVNVREIGFYLDEEVLTGKAFIPGITPLNTLSTSQNFRQVLRKVIDFGALPNSATKSVAHGITFDANFTLIFLGAAATDPIAFLAIPIPFTDTAATANQVRIDMDATNINITTGLDRTSYTRCFIVIEYLVEE